MIRILLLSDYSREPERRLLQGFMRYAHKNGGCTVFTVTNYLQNDPKYTGTILDRAKSLNVDAIFGRWPGIDLKVADKTEIPIILRTIDQIYPGYPMLYGNYREMGIFAAEFFLRQHYVSFAYFGVNRFLWAIERRDGFKERLKREKVLYSELCVADTSKEWDQIATWLSSLPKPSAIYACNDVNAKILCEICQYLNIRIPEDLAILGTDNDEFMCALSFPGLSSIMLDYEKQGENTCRALFTILEKKERMELRIPVNILGIAERETTRKHNVSDPYVMGILNKIDTDFPSIRKLKDITDNIPLSKRAIEKRFNKEMSPWTMSSYLADVRIRHLCSLLENTDLPISEAARNVGFDDPFYVSKVLKKATGLSPSSWRRQSKSRKSEE